VVQFELHHYQAFGLSTLTMREPCGVKVMKGSKMTNTTIPITLANWSVLKSLKSFSDRWRFRSMACPLFISSLATRNRRSPP
jgi:hypothetical protein